MNAVEIEEAVSELAAQPFDRAEFPYAFLKAFDNKDTTIKKLRSGASNSSDIADGVLQRNNIHIATCDEGKVNETLAALRQSPKTAAAKAKFILATDGKTLEAEDLISGEPLSTPYEKFAEHFSLFLPLAGISYTAELKETELDRRAAKHLQKLYLELLKENPAWDTAERRHDINHFMARLIFCFFAEDTGIFQNNIFTRTIETMSDGQSGNTHEVLSELFRAMDTPTTHHASPDDRHRRAAGIKSWADKFPYVNGHLFSGEIDCPKFSRMARSYLLRAGGLDWKQINPDIFGSMIQAVAEDEERGALGMHYTSVPNILKVLNPLFLDDLREQLEAAGDNSRMLLNLRKRMSKIRVFDPACGSGNFLVIAYKEMRAIEAEINLRRAEADHRSEIPLTNLRGIELHDFPAEIARLALIIAEYQCDVLYRGQQEALAEFLPLNAENWITCGNALRLDWLSVCEPPGTKSQKIFSDDLFGAPLDQTKVEFANEGGETYICGNPPYKGSQSQNAEQKSDLRTVLEKYTKSWKSLDYVAGWFAKAAEYCEQTAADAAFVATNSLCQGRSVDGLWPAIQEKGVRIFFAHTSFHWSNLASHNAGVTVIIVGLTKNAGRKSKIFSEDVDGKPIARAVDHINAYLVAAPSVIVSAASKASNGLATMSFGNMPIDGGHLQLDRTEALSLEMTSEQRKRFVKRIYGAAEFIRGLARFCLWIDDASVLEAESIADISNRLQKVSKFRSLSERVDTRELADTPHRFGWISQSGRERFIILPRISSERREYLPAGYEDAGVITTDQAYAMPAAPMWNLAVLSSRLHLNWAATVCGKLKTDIRYSNTLGWNTFPVPKLTDQNKADLTRCAENILLAREAHFPKTIADLYDPDEMPDDLRRAHDENDEVLERIYIGRRFKNDTERLEKLFDLYTKMTAQQPQPTKKKGRKAA